MKLYYHRMILAICVVAFLLVPFGTFAEAFFRLTLPRSVELSAVTNCVRGVKAETEGWQNRFADALAMYGRRNALGRVFYWELAHPTFGIVRNGGDELTVAEILLSGMINFRLFKFSGVRR